MATLLFFHSLFRWLVVASLGLSLYRAWTGYRSGRAFTKRDNSIRHWTATIAHVQLILGLWTLFRSQNARFFWEYPGEGWQNIEYIFYGFLHGGMMLVAIVLLTIGSAKAKRATEDRSKFRTMLIWYGLAAVIILIAIPWPFSPFSHRPFYRSL